MMEKMKKHRVAFLVSHVTQYHAPFYKYLASDPNYDVTVYFCTKRGAEETLDEGFGKSYKWDIPLLEGYRHVFLKNYSSKLGSTFFGQINPGIIWELKKEKHDALIVHGYMALTNWFAFIACWFTNTPVILKGEADLQKKLGIGKKLIKRIVLVPLFKTMDAFLYSYTRNKEFFRFYGAHERELFFYPCSVDNEHFKKEQEHLGSDKEKLRKKLEVTKPKLPSILFVGKFIPRKRVMDILEACVKVKEKEEFNLLLVGDGEERNKLENFVNGHHIPNVYFFGFKNQSELPVFYAASDVFVLPSSSDPSPKAMNEAMNFALPVITTTDVGTAPDLVLYEKTGFTYRVGDVHALSKLLGRILESSELRHEMSVAARKLVYKWNFEEMKKGVDQALAYVSE